MRYLQFLFASLFLAGSALAAEAPKRVLLVTHAGGYMHDSILIAEQVLNELGRKNGYVLTCYRFTADPDKKITVKRKVGGKNANAGGAIILVYDIKKPDGAPATGHLATDLAEALKLRVDPKGVRNLIWRPQGDDRLEIQMPLSADAADAAAARVTLRDNVRRAETTLRGTNVQSIGDLIEAIKTPDSDAKTFQMLVGDSPERMKVCLDLKDLWVRLQKARAAHDPKSWSLLQSEFDAQIPPAPTVAGEVFPAIERTNIAHDQLDEILSATQVQKEDNDEARKLKTAQRMALLDALKLETGNFPSRAKAIDGYVDAFEKLSASLGELDDAADLKRMLRGAGILEFHVLATDIADYRKYVNQLLKDGPRVHAGDEARWFEVNQSEKVGHVQVYHYKPYVLAYITPSADGKPRSLDSHTEKPWHLRDAHAGMTREVESVVNFSFDPQGAIYFGELTEANLKKPIAIVLDNKVISAPVVQSKITTNGQITGPPAGGFSLDELDYLVNTLRAGSMPAALSDDPISERFVAAPVEQVEVEITALEDYSAHYQKLMGEPVTRENCGRINAQTLKNFDAVIFFTTSTWKKDSGSHPLTPDELNDLIAWVNNGGAFVAVHCGSDTLHNTAYGDLVGGTFGGHPWLQKVRIHVEDPNHPAGKAFTEGAEIMDEIYQFGPVADRPKSPMVIQPYSREKLHIITTIDPTSIDLKIGARDDHDYASSWCHAVGKGRSFYTALGHHKAVWLDPRFQEHLMGGLKWAMGLLPGDATPSAQLKK